MFEWSHNEKHLLVGGIFWASSTTNLLQLLQILRMVLERRRLQVESLVLPIDYLEQGFIFGLRLVEQDLSLERLLGVVVHEG